MRAAPLVPRGLPFLELNDELHEAVASNIPHTVRTQVFSAHEGDLARTLECRVTNRRPFLRQRLCQTCLQIHKHIRQGMSVIDAAVIRLQAKLPNADSPILKELQMRARVRVCVEFVSERDLLQTE